MIANGAIMTGEMNDRSSKILEAAIEEFIGSGEPISSGRLYEHYKFGIRPAMIRLELEKLSEEGFLEQPHHSAGRVPTDRGYEFFAERALGAEDEQRPAEGEVRKRRQSAVLERTLHNILARHAWPEFVEELSSELQLLGIASEPKRKSLYKEGLDSLIENLEWSTDEEIKSVIRDFVEIDERLSRIAGRFADGEPQVFIGKKSPITRSENLSVVMRGWESGGTSMLLLAIGPKRMDYRKTLRVFKNL